LGTAAGLSLFDERKLSRVSLPDSDARFAKYSLLRLFAYALHGKTG
jgi:hypothetical protein